MVAGALILLFNSIIERDLPTEIQYTIKWSFPAGILILSCGVISFTNESFYNWLTEKLNRVAVWLGVSALQVFLLIISPIFALLAINAAGFWIRMRNPYIAVLSWFIGISLAVIGGWNFREKLPRSSKSDILWCVAVTALAFLLRNWASGAIPILLNGDEGSAGVGALDYTSGEWNNIFVSSWFSFPSLFTYLQSISIRVYGNTVEALRLPSAIGGALTVGAVYLWGRSMFGPRSGLIAALTLAALHIHIHFSRLGLNNIWDGFWFILTIGATWYGWERGERWAYLLAGLGMGFGQYFYATSRFLPILLLIALLLACIFQRARLRVTLSEIVILLVAANAAMFPLIWYYIHEPNALLAPFARSSLLRESIFMSAQTGISPFWQLANALGAYTFSDLLIYYAPLTPILRPIPAICFYLGLIFLLLNKQDSRLFLLTLWLILFGFISAASSFYPASQRYVAATPACALLVGYGIHKSADYLEKSLPRIRLFISGAAYLILLAIMFSDLFFYFFTFTPATYFDELNSNGALAYQLALKLKDEPTDTMVIFPASARMSANSPAILYLAPQIKGLNTPGDWASLDQSLLTADRIIFVFLHENINDLDKAKTDFPGGSLSIVNDWNGATLMWLYEIQLR